MAYNAEQWLAALAAELGTEPPTRDQMEDLLDLAGVSARASERTAAPVSCWLAARADREPTDALAVARSLAGDLN
jgi:hypothetical protein